MSDFSDIEMMTLSGDFLPCPNFLTLNADLVWRLLTFHDFSDIECRPCFGDFWPCLTLLILKADLVLKKLSDLYDIECCFFILAGLQPYLTLYAFLVLQIYNFVLKLNADLVFKTSDIAWLVQHWMLNFVDLALSWHWLLTLSCRLLLRVSRLLTDSLISITSLFFNCQNILIKWDMSYFFVCVSVHKCVHIWKSDFILIAYKLSNAFEHPCTQTLEIHWLFLLHLASLVKFFLFELNLFQCFLLCKTYWIPLELTNFFKEISYLPIKCIFYNIIMNRVGKIFYLVYFHAVSLYWVHLEGRIVYMYFPNKAPYIPLDPLKIPTCNYMGVFISVGHVEITG